MHTRALKYNAYLNERTGEEEMVGVPGMIQNLFWGDPTGHIPNSEIEAAIAQYKLDTQNPCKSVT